MVEVNEKYLFYEAKSILRNIDKYTEKKVEDSQNLVDEWYLQNPHLKEPIKKVCQKEIQRIKDKYNIKN